MGGFFPWFLFLPAALFRALRKGLGETNDGTLFLMLWFGAIFLFFSTASSKLSTYILPLFPAVSLLVAALWGDLWVLPAQEAPRKAILYPLAFFMATTTAVLVYILVKPLDALLVTYGIAPARINILGFIMVAGTGLIFFLFLNRRYKTAFAAMTGMVVSRDFVVPRAYRAVYQSLSLHKGPCRKTRHASSPGRKADLLSPAAGYDIVLYGQEGLDPLGDNSP